MSKPQNGDSQALGASAFGLRKSKPSAEVERILLSGGIVIDPTMGASEQKDLLIENGRVAALGEIAPELSADAKVIDVNGMWIMPGLIQSHVHMAQTMLRGMAEGLPLLPWLSKKVLPLEASHDADTLYASARLGIAELLLSGCTGMLDFGSVNHAEAIFEAAREMGIRMTSGKIMMDSGAAPESLKQDAELALNQSVDLFERYHNRENGRLRVAFIPRFLLSCSEQLLSESLRLAAERDTVWHSHVAEQPDEVKAVVYSTGMRSMQYLDKLGAGDARLCLAHMIHLDDMEKQLLASFNASVLHCPRANTKLGSGVCPVGEYRKMGIPVGIGSDGSPCNNRLDMFEEMRAAAALQDLAHRPGALSSTSLLAMASSEGAHATGLEDVAGLLELGMRADLIVLDPGHPAILSGALPADAIVHNGDARAIKMVMVDGKTLVEDGRLLCADIDQIKKEATEAIAILKRRAFD